MGQQQQGKRGKTKGEGWGAGGDPGEPFWCCRCGWGPVSPSYFVREGGGFHFRPYTLKPRIRGGRAVGRLLRTRSLLTPTNGVLPG